MSVAADYISSRVFVHSLYIVSFPPPSPNSTIGISHISIVLCSAQLGYVCTCVYNSLHTFNLAETLTPVRYILSTSPRCITCFSLPRKPIVYSMCTICLICVVCVLCFMLHMSLGDVQRGVCIGACIG